ncbi:hypothetical protein SynBIOSU31_02658 [Synechococcus sp. BIOS-U3-1]|nr:hypothetical protein SynBIOSU31_02658 [Synechococcus sp. BIOS-U3-1]
MSFALNTPPRQVRPDNCNEGPLPTINEFRPQLNGIDLLRPQHNPMRV